MPLWKLESFWMFCILYICRLKRTTDIMFGGKQVLVCGYGEVCSIYVLPTLNNYKPLYILPSTISSYPYQQGIQTISSYSYQLGIQTISSYPYQLGIHTLLSISPVCEDDTMFTCTFTWGYHMFTSIFTCYLPVC